MVGCRVSTAADRAKCTATNINNLHFARVPRYQRSLEHAVFADRE
jgi:hypothetical protein